MPVGFHPAGIFIYVKYLCELIMSTKTNLTIGILAHVDAGKTTLSECMLYNAGMLRSMGRVDKKDSFFDTDEMERQRGITIFSKQAVFDLSDSLRITLIDTPGHADFSPEAERALWVMDYAILVISAADSGVLGRSRYFFDLLGRYDIPVFTFVNKMDQPGADKESVLRELKKSFSDQYVDFSAEGSPDFYEEVAAASSALEGDPDIDSETVMDEFFSTEQVNNETISALIGRRILFPVWFGSALNDDGVEGFMKMMDKYISLIESVRTAAKTSDPFKARVFKISRDNKGNRLTHMKILSGGLKVRDKLGDEQITGIRVYNGEKYESVNDTNVGGLYAITGLQNTYGGQGLGEEPDLSGEIAAFGSSPVMTYRLEAVDGTYTNPVELMKKLEELCEYMPELQATWDEQLKEIHVSIMGEVHLEILKKLIKDKYDTDVSFGAGRILYKETIADIVEGVGHFEPLRHYAEVHLKLEPGERGSGITVGDSLVSVDELALNWQRLIETHIMERKHRGVLTGSPITDIKITLVGGRSHNKHTMGGDFRQAVYRAIRQGLMQARSVLLEPYYDVELRIPISCVGRAMTDLERVGAKQITQESLPDQDTSLVKGRAPASSMQDYPNRVAEYTGGRGMVSLLPCGYDICHNSVDIISETSYDPLSDVRNTPDSVFCSHGAGEVVPWDKVFEYMHVPNKLIFNEDGSYEGVVLVDEAQSLLEAAERVRSAAISKTASDSVIPMGYEEVDEIVARAGSANLKGHAGNRGNGVKKLKRVDTNAIDRKRTYAEPKEGFVLVDGYNVIYSIKELKELAAIDMGAARIRLLDLVSNYKGVRDEQFIVVFDAYTVKRQGADLEQYHNITVVYTPMAQTADAYIEKYAHTNASKYDITVITSDGTEQVIVRGAGCRLMSARDFEAELGRLNESLGDYLS